MACGVLDTTDTKRTALKRKGSRRFAMRPASAGCAPGRRSRVQVTVSNRGLCRQTEPRDADTQMQDFLDNGTVPVLSFKASREEVQASLVLPLQAVATELMGIATAILDRVVAEWGCVEHLVQETRGEKIDRRQAEEFIDEYLKHHRVPGKLQVRWVKNLSSGGKLQEYGRRGEPTKRRLRLWISSGFAGVGYSRSMTAFADHEICTHAVRAINDHAQVWVNHRGRYGLCSSGRERLSTEEGLAALNSLLCYPSQTQHLWSAAMLYYCAVKGQDMGFGELHKHLRKYVRCPAKRYWYCVRTKGKRAELDKPGSCGKGQVYLEGAVEILRAVDTIDFHLLYSGRVPLSKFERVRHIVRSSLVTLPRFVQDQAKYKAILKQIGRLNGILPDNLRPLCTRPKGTGRLGNSPTRSKRCNRAGRGGAVARRRTRAVIISRDTPKTSKKLEMAASSPAADGSEEAWGGAIDEVSIDVEDVEAFPTPSCRVDAAGGRPGAYTGHNVKETGPVSDQGSCCAAECGEHDMVWSDSQDGLEANSSRASLPSLNRLTGSALSEAGQSEPRTSPPLATAPVGIPLYLGASGIARTHSFSSPVVVEDRHPSSVVDMNALISRKRVGGGSVIAARLRSSSGTNNNSEADGSIVPQSQALTGKALPQLGGKG